MQKLNFYLNVTPYIGELNEFPELWDRYDMRRTMYEGSPHRECHDIWLRYNDYSNFDENNPLAFSDTHESVWYSAAWMMPKIKSLVMQIYYFTNSQELGGVLITKVPAWACVHPHVDTGWHAEHYDKKYLFLLKSAPGQTFEFKGGEVHEGEAGELFVFNNQIEHAVYNNSYEDRVSLLMAVR